MGAANKLPKLGWKAWRQIRIRAVIISAYHTAFERTGRVVTQDRQAQLDYVAAAKKCLGTAGPTPKSIVSRALSRFRGGPATLVGRSEGALLRRRLHEVIACAFRKMRSLYGPEWAQCDDGRASEAAYEAFRSELADSEREQDATIRAGVFADVIDGEQMAVARRRSHRILLSITIGIASTVAGGGVLWAAEAAGPGKAEGRDVAAGAVVGAFGGLAAAAAERNSNRHYRSSLVSAHAAMDDYGYTVLQLLDKLERPLRRLPRAPPRPLDRVRAGVTLELDLADVAGLDPSRHIEELVDLRASDLDDTVEIAERLLDQATWAHLTYAVGRVSEAERVLADVRALACDVRDVGHGVDVYTFSAHYFDVVVRVRRLADLIVRIVRTDHDGEAAA